MLILSLTPRRLETLATLQRLTDQAGDAVHYSLVGARMRISAWTAYGLLRELEKMGLVVRKYALGRQPRQVGRSRILFAPAAHQTVVDDGEGARRMRATFERFSAIKDESAAARAYLAETGTDLAYQLGFWMGRVEAAGRHAHEAALSVLESGAVPAAKIQAVAAMGLGSALARLGRSRLAGRMADAATGFTVLLEEAGRASDQRLQTLVDAARRLEVAP